MISEGDKVRVQELDVEYIAKVIIGEEKNWAPYGRQLYRVEILEVIDDNKPDDYDELDSKDYEELSEEEKKRYNRYFMESDKYVGWTRNVYPNEVVHEQKKPIFFIC